MEMKRDTEWGIDPNSGPDDDYNRCIRLMLEVMVDFGSLFAGVWPTIPIRTSWK